MELLTIPVLHGVKLWMAFVLLCSLASVAVCQNGDWVQSTTPKVLSIDTETSKPGQASAHEKIESGWRRAFNKANYPSYFLGLSSITGSSTMVFLTAYDSFEAGRRTTRARIQTSGCRWSKKN